MPHDSASHDAVKDGEPKYPSSGELPLAKNMYPADVSEEDYQRFCKWFKGASHEHMLDVFQNGPAGGASVALIAACKLYVQPEVSFEPPWLMELEERHGGSSWVNDFEIYTAVLNEDMEIWIASERVSECIRNYVDLHINDPRGEAYVLELAERGLGRITMAPADDNERDHTWFRLDWPRVLRWWASGLEESKGRFSPDGYVYILGVPDFYKIGKAQSVDSRVKQLRIQLPWAVDVVHTIPCEGYSEAERALHECFADRRANGEWFVLTPGDVEWLTGITRMWGNKAEFDHE